MDSLRVSHAFRWSLPLIAFAALLAVLALVNRSPSLPGTGTSGGSGAERSAASQSTGDLIESLRAAVREDPADANAYALLGDAYYQRSRETGNADFYGRAEHAYDAALARDPNELIATIGLGTLALARHDFRSGLELGRQAHELAPDLARPYAVLVDARIELGRYAAAARTLDRMVRLKPTLAAYSRVSYFRELNGDIRGAVQAMRLAVSAGSGSPEGSAYVRHLLGDLELLRGRPEAARDAFRGALAVSPGYVPAIEGMAEVDLAQGELDSAVHRLREAVERQPGRPDSVLALGEAQQLAGHGGVASRLYERVENLERRLLAGGSNPDAGLVHFEADHGQIGQALRLGREVWRAAPSVTSADAFSWALYRAGRIERAAALSEEAMRLGSRSPEFLYHAGVIASRAGHRSDATRYLERLLAQSPGYDPAVGPSAERVLERPR